MRYLRWLGPLGVVAGTAGVGLLLVTGFRTMDGARQLDAGLDLVERRLESVHAATTAVLADPVAWPAVVDARTQAAEAVAALEASRKALGGHGSELDGVAASSWLGVVGVLPAPGPIDTASRTYTEQSNGLIDSIAAGEPHELAQRLLDVHHEAVVQRLGEFRAATAQVRSRALVIVIAAGLAGLGGAAALGLLLAGARPRSSARPARSGTVQRLGAEESRLCALAPTSDMVAVIDLDGTIRRADGAVEPLCRRSAESLVNLKLIALVQPSDREGVQGFIAECRTDRTRAHPVEVRARHDETSWYRLETFGNRRREDPAIDGVMVRLSDISARRQAEDALRQSSEMLQTLTEASPLAITVEDPQGRVRLWNAAAQKVFGWSAEDVVGSANPTIPESAAQEHRNLGRQVLQGHAFTALESTRVAKDGSVVHVSISTAPLRGAEGNASGMLEVISDITEHKQLQVQLMQAQKMEGIGRLAGGIAHDFNNLLTAILGQADLIMRSFEKSDEARPGVTASSTMSPRLGVEQIQRAAERAAQLTQQLLAFSRNQVLQPTDMDLNRSLAEMEDMLRRLIGEDIDLAFVPGPDLGQITADPTQITQVVMNLAVNARDAMPNGGKLTIETATVELDETYATRRMAVVPGEYVLLAVSDNGHGMDKATLDRVFEPFFTTKERGKGTGLGLATVYGIVKQSGGYIWCYSEPGKGTSFKVYLPCTKSRADRSTPVVRRPAQPPPAGSETVLLVEDEEMVRSLVCQVLKWYGYKVLEAENGEAAIRVAQNHQGPIHLLISDLVMPGMSALDMVKELAPPRPQMRLIFMSGYTDHAAVRHQLAAGDVPYIQKPFAPDRLAHKVREVLNSPWTPRQWAVEARTDEAAAVPSASRA